MINKSKSFGGLMIKIQCGTKIKLNKSLFIIMFMLISTLNIPYSLIICLLTGLMIVAYGVMYGNGEWTSRSRDVNRLALSFMMVIVGYMVFQILFLEMNFYEIRQYVCAYYAIFLPVFLATFLSKCFMLVVSSGRNIQL